MDKIELAKKLMEESDSNELRSFPIAECQCCGEKAHLYRCEIHGTLFCRDCLKAVVQVNEHRSVFKAKCPELKSGQNCNFLNTSASEQARYTVIV